MSAGEVVVSPAGVTDRPVLTGLFQFYMYHFSGFEEHGSNDLDFEANGLFAPFEHLESYFTDPARSAHIVRVGGKVAGFVLMNDHSHCGAQIDHNIGEFFIAAKFRRGGVGGEVLRQMVVGRPGRWEAAIAAKNTSAQAFWPLAIAALPGVRDVTTTNGDGQQWNGPILHFTVPG